MENITTQPTYVDNKNIKTFKTLLIISISLLILVTLTLVYLLTQFKELKNNQKTDSSIEMSLKNKEPINSNSAQTTPKKTITSNPVQTTLSDEEQVRGLHCKDGTCDANTAVTIIEISGNYAHGRADASACNCHWYAVKIDGTWKIIWKTQDGVPCQIVEKYQIPDSMLFEQEFEGKRVRCQPYSQESLDEENQRYQWWTQ